MKMARRLLALALLTTAAEAHHGAVGSPGLYDIDEMIIVEGEITKLFWRPPHVRFTLQTTGSGDDDKTWIIESGVPRQMESTGLTAEMFYVGQHVKVAGYQARFKDDMLGLMNILFENGVEHVYKRDGTTMFSDNRFQRGGGMGRTPPDPEALAAEAASLSGIFRPWRSEERMADLVARMNYEYLLSEKGRETYAAYDPIQHPLITDCSPRGMPERMLAASLDIVDEGGRIRIRQLWWGGDRIIHLDGSAPDEDTPYTHLGYSTGRWENDRTLVVETTHINWPYFDKEGFPQSDQVRIVERFTLNDDDTRLDYVLTSHDPVMYTEPLVDRSHWVWQPGTRAPQTGTCEMWTEVGE